jgi:hypothetical protein
MSLDPVQLYRQFRLWGLSPLSFLALQGPKALYGRSVQLANSNTFDGTNCSHGIQKKSSPLEKMVLIGAPLDAISGLSFLNHREMLLCP